MGQSIGEAWSGGQRNGGGMGGSGLTNTVANNAAAHAASSDTPALAAGDPYWASVVTLLKFEGTNGSTTLTDLSTKGKTWTVGGNAQISTAQAKYGSSCLLTGTTGHIQCTMGTDGAFGTGDFTMEGYGYGTNITANCLFYATNSTATFDYYLYNRAFNYGANQVTTQTMAWANGAWFHWAICRTGTQLEGWINGTRQFVATSSQNFSCDTRLDFGWYKPSSGLFWNEYMDEIRLTKGVARYTGATITVPTASFPTSA